MDNENTVEGVVTTQENNNEGGGEESKAEMISISKSEWEKNNQTLGSLKRELKDLRKPKEDSEKVTASKPNNSLLEKAFLRSAQITDAEEVELALNTAKKWGVTVDALVDDEDFRVKLDKLRTTKANTLATSNIKGGAGTSQAKFTAEYWSAKGTPPTPADVPDRKTRANIVKAMMGNSKNTAKFYND